MDAELRRMAVFGVHVDSEVGEVMLLLVLDEPSTGEEELVVPVSIGPREGAAIASVQAGIVPPRPQTHDLALDLLHAAGGSLLQVEIVKLLGGVFFAELVLGSGRRVDARTSDAVALALRASVPILCHPGVLDAAGVQGGPWIAARVDSEGELAEFREFLESVEPEDFDDQDS
ncbi:bifunctional nuclease family protein [Miniimonas arenae]|nr:bifunctional nuclease family protein [Miniimonas arenae]